MCFLFCAFTDLRPPLHDFRLFWAASPVDGFSFFSLRYSPCHGCRKYDTVIKERPLWTFADARCSSGADFLLPALLLSLFACDSLYVFLFDSGGLFIYTLLVWSGTLVFDFDFWYCFSSFDFGLDCCYMDRYLFSPDNDTRLHLVFILRRGYSSALLHWSGWPLIIILMCSFCSCSWERVLDLGIWGPFTFYYIPSFVLFALLIVLSRLYTLWYIGLLLSWDGGGFFTLFIVYNFHFTILLYFWPFVSASLLHFSSTMLSLRSRVACFSAVARWRFYYVVNRLVACLVCLGSLPLYRLRHFIFWSGWLGGLVFACFNVETAGSVLSFVALQLQPCSCPAGLLSLFSFVVFYSSCLFCLTSSSPYHTQDAFNLLL